MIRFSAFVLLLWFAAVSAESKLPGESFPEFNVKERCELMSQSSSERIKRMASVCLDRETEYKKLAATLWNMADESTKFECDISASLAFGSYEILTNCLRDQSALLGASE